MTSKKIYIAPTNGSVYRAARIITDFELSIHNIEPIWAPTLKQLALVYGESQAYIRKTLVEHYGKRITFKRGRNGGIRLTNFPLVSGQYHL